MLEEVEALFARFQKTDRRLTLFTKLAAYVSEVKRAGCGNAVILDGRLRNIGVGLVWGSPSNPGARAATYTADFGFKG